VSGLQNQPDWARLFRVACALIRQVNSEALIIDHWTFGGGTALMLQIGHRESRDVDLFLTDPQLLPFLDPQKNDFDFEIRPSDYDGDGAKFLKFAFDGIGEIDFIVSPSKTKNPTVEQEIEGHRTLLETVPEIIAKKIVHRGANLKPRDIFDIAAASVDHQAAVVDSLRAYEPEVTVALATLDRLKPDFVNAAIGQLDIREKFSEIAKVSIERSRSLLRTV
jgi:hypothetical protein